MRSVRQHLEELLDVRADATSVSQWHAVIAVKERARRLLNDALHTYDFHIGGVLFSIGISGMPVTVALHKDVARVTYVELTADTQGVTRRRPVASWRHQPTALTNMLKLEERLTTWLIDRPITYWLEIGYDMSARDVVLPKDLGLSATLNTSIKGFQVTGGRSIDTFPSVGFLELTHPMTTTDAREVVHYQFLTATGFSGLTRGIEGEPKLWSQGTVISFAAPMPNSALPVMMDAAQGALYDALLSDRAFYDKYTAIASEQASPPERLAGLARTFEDKAERGFRRTRRLPSPTQFRRKRFRR